MLKSVLEQAVTADEDSRRRFVSALADDPAPTLAELVQMRGQIGQRLALLMRVFTAIGYPTNAEAIPWVVANIGTNRGAWYETMQAVTALGPLVAVPYLIERLLGVPPGDPNRATGIEDLCPLLRDLDRAFAAGCGPTIVHLLATNSYPEDPCLLVDVLEVVGPSCVEYALPSLIDLLGTVASRECAAQIQHLIGSFDSDAVAPYQRVLARTGLPATSS